jgi:hypothetical protein
MAAVATPTVIQMDFGTHDGDGGAAHDDYGDLDGHKSSDAGKSSSSGDSSAGKSKRARFTRGKKTGGDGGYME